MKTYEQAATTARELMHGGDDESLRMAAGEALNLAPNDGERQYWKSVVKALAKGLTSFATKETVR